jgi:hypothetical protein
LAYTSASRRPLPISTAVASASSSELLINLSFFLVAVELVSVSRGVISGLFSVGDGLVLWAS